MANSNTEVIKYAQNFLGQGGGTFRNYCGLPAGTAYCNAFVTYVLHKTGNAKLYCNGTKQTYCPNSIQWCYKHLANIPIYLALPGDIIYFDWEPNGTPNHIGFVRERKSDQEIYTLEGNTSGGIVAKKTRTVKYVQAVFRPGYKATFDISKPLEVDGYYGYNSIAQLQRVLHVGIDGDLGQITVKALQRMVGVTADGSWGRKTSKAVQKLIGVKQDGEFGPDSVKALQKWLNKQIEGFTDTKPIATTSSGTVKSNAIIGKTEIRKTQKYLHKTKDGILSGQSKSLHKKYFPAIADEAIEYGEGGSATVRALQAMLLVKITGRLNESTVKAWQRLIGEKDDGVFGEKSAKAWIKFLAKPWHEKANLWAEFATGKFAYKSWDSKNKKTQTCFICNERTDYISSQCIGAAFMIWRHGGGLNCKCNYSVISGGDDNNHNEPAERLLKAKTKAEADAMATKMCGIKVEVIRNGGKAIPKSMLKAGDIIMLYDHASGQEYQHTCYYMGGGKLADNTGGRTPNFKAKVNYSGRYATNTKVAIRPVI